MYAATSARVIALGGELTSRKFFGSSIQLAHRSEASSIVVLRTRKLPQSIVTRFCGAVGAGASAMGPSTGGLAVIERHLPPTRAAPKCRPQCESTRRSKVMSRARLPFALYRPDLRDPSPARPAANFH